MKILMLLCHSPNEASAYALTKKMAIKISIPNLNLNEEDFEISMAANDFDD